MQHQDYWIKRFELLEAAQNDKGVEYYHNLTKQYTKAISSIEKDIAKWYARYATENEITLTEAKRLLNSRELAEFRMDVKEYIEKGESLDPQWAKQLEAASVRVHVSRLEALKVQMQQQAEMLYGFEKDGLDDLARRIYTDGYYQSAYEIQKGIGVGWDLMRLDANKINKVISKPWAADGRNFSDRLWANKTQLVSELENTLTQSIMRGHAPKKAIDQIAARMKVSKTKAGRLVMTESAFFASAAQKDAFTDLDVEKFEIIATLDSRTSDTCRYLDGKVIPMKDYKPGVTAPPFHVWCRTTTAPYFGDEFTVNEQRAARDEDGKYYTVPASMKYHDWEKTFVDGGSKKGLEPAKIKNMSLGDKVANIKTALGQKQNEIVEKKNKIKDLTTEGTELLHEAGSLKTKSNDLAAKKEKFKLIGPRKLEDELAESRKAIKELEAEKDKLDAISNRYYNGKPDRKIDREKWLAWSDWRKSVDIGDVFNKQVKINSDLSIMRRERDELEELLEFKRTFDADAIEKELKALQAEIDKKERAAKELRKTRMALQDEVVAMPTELEQYIKSAGKEVTAELRKNTALAERGKKIKALQIENDRLADEYAKVQKMGTKEQRIKIYDDWVEVNGKLNKAINDGFKLNAADVKNVLSEVREMGSGDLDVIGHLNNTKSKHRNVMLDAYDVYPKEWIEKSIQRGKLQVKAVSRGYYSDTEEIIAISGTGQGRSFGTAIHEIGHRLEKAVPEILEAERVFYERRTANEELKWLGANYSKSEKSRFDDFLSAYMGKDYGGDAYELVSMGFEWGYTNPERLFEDEDMAEWIYGLLALY